MRFIVLTVTALLAVAIQAQPVELETRSEDLASLDSRSYYQCPMYPAPCNWRGSACKPCGDECVAPGEKCTDKKKKGKGRGRPARAGSSGGSGSGGKDDKE